MHKYILTSSILTNHTWWIIPEPGFQKPTPYLAPAVARKLYTSWFTSWGVEGQGRKEHKWWITYWLLFRNRSLGCRIPLIQVTQHRIQQVLIQLNAVCSLHTLPKHFPTLKPNLSTLPIWSLSLLFIQPLLHFGLTSVICNVHYEKTWPWYLLNFEQDSCWASLDKASAKCINVNVDVFGLITSI